MISNLMCIQNSRASFGAGFGPALVDIIFIRISARYEVSFYILNVIIILQQYTLYDRKREKTIVIIMRVWQNLFPLLDNLYKRLKEAETSV